MIDPERQAGFPGFASPQARLVAVPDEFFVRLLPQLDHLGELKLLLHVFWLLTNREAEQRHVGEQELYDDPALLKSLRAGQSRPAGDLLREAIDRAVVRRVLLRVQVNDAGAPQVWYFLNSPAGRRALATARVATLPAADGLAVADPTAAGETPLQADLPSIFSLYEQNVGLLTPLIADALRAADERYPAGWLRDAIRESAERNRRSWRYIQRILERWEAEGKGNATHRDGPWPPANADRYTKGRYGRLVQS
ncbi:MAG TPA: DnaD domain protein [Chloroflexota bacterium]|jgi:DnaD/phage-associated family protein|nr:DnaD domain protein [Chloroflexota bacterium]